MTAPPVVAQQQCLYPAEFVATVLAATVGTRLFPLTSDEDAVYMPKHLLPVAGIPCLFRLLAQLQAAGFTETIVVIADADNMTVPALLNLQKEPVVPGYRYASCSSNDEKKDDATTILWQTHQAEETSKSNHNKKQLRCKPQMKISVVTLSPDCPDSVSAIVEVEQSGLVHSSSHLVVLPGDLVVLDTTLLEQLCHAHRRGNQIATTTTTASTTISTEAAACTVLLSDVGELDDQTGLPLKESAKQKKGGLAREEGEVEYIALSYSTTTSEDSAPPPRIVWKQSKLDVEQDEDMVGSTPKLQLPLARVHDKQKVVVQTSLQDVHCFAVSPWIRKLLVALQTNDSSIQLHSLQQDLIPLLVSRQYKGMARTFGSTMDPQVVEEALRSVVVPTTASSTMHSSPSKTGNSGAISTPSTTNAAAALQNNNAAYTVQAHVVPNTAVRAHSVSAYQYACKELVHRAVEQQQQDNKQSVLLPAHSTLQTKFHSLQLQGATCSDKVHLRNTVLGKDCKIGSKCRLNQVVLLDGCTVGANTTLQNSVLAQNCQIGENCSLNDCQVAAGRVIAAGTKEKGEAFLHETT